MPQKHQPRTRKPALSSIAGTLLMVLLAGCATPKSARLEVPSSALQGDSTSAEGRQVSGQGSDALQRSQPAVAKRAEKPLFSQIESMATAEMRAPSNQNVDLAAFSPDQQVQLRSDQLPLEEFLHEVFGKLLQVSYTIDQTLERRLSETVTLNLQESVSQRELFRLTTRLLTSKQIDVIGRDGVYFITSQQDRGGRDVRIGVGSRPSDVPESDSDVLQIVTVKYGTPRGFQVVLKELFAVNIQVQEEKQFMFIQGSAPNVRRALELLRLIDAPASRAREVGLIDLVYLQPDELLADLEQLLDAEGISLGRGQTKGPLAVVPLTRRQAVVVFSSDRGLLQRVYYWARQLDVPGETTEKEYFLYEPQNARAVDMGESLERLISLSEGGSSGSFGGSRRATETNNATSGSVEAGSESESGASASGGSVRGENLSMVVDERQNKLMFYATPAEYDKVRPLLLRLDQSPPQVALEVIIAEVTLTDELQFGVEWFLEKNNYSLGTLGALGIGSSGLNITAIDADLGLDVIANLSKTENLVNVLSRPRIVVTDGSSATVNVGTDIPILTSTASDVSSGELGGGTTIVQTVQYRSTGVLLNVTPTVNGQGMVAMELSQEISNTSSDAIPGINSPVISQRSFQTSLMVGDGQTAVVGGLISDNNTQGATAVPWLSDIPWLGRLFRSETRGRDKTEILVMITPRIINGASDMQGLTERLMDGMEGLTLGRDIEAPIEPD